MEHEQTHASLEEQLLGYDVLPWCVRVILEKCEADVVRRQLTYHGYRLDAGFQARTEGGAAKLLFRACLNDWPAPKGFFERQARAAAPSTQSRPEPTVEAVASTPVSARAVTAALAAPAAEPTPHKSRWARCRASGLAFPVRHWFGDGCVLILPDGDNQLVEAPRYGLYDWFQACPEPALAATG